jgi:hypothetical protein
MRKYPIAPVVMPAELHGMSNGQLGNPPLVIIKGGRLCSTAAKAWKAMVAAAAKDGITLEPTSAADTYRPLQVQQITFLKRYDNTLRMSKPKKYMRKLWWLKPGKAGAAVPGTSNHGWGLAVDVKDATGARLVWLLKYAQSFGFSWEDDSEPWHIRYVAGDVVPPAVKPKK